MEPRHRSTLEAVTRATTREGPAYVGDRNWHQRLYDTLTSPEARKNAMIGAGVAAAATFAPMAAYHLAHVAAGGGIDNTNFTVHDTKKQTYKAALDAGLGTVAGIVGGAVGGPAGSVAAGLVTSTFTTSAQLGLVGAENGAEKKANSYFPYDEY